jgi:hypothetical protein
VSDPNARHGRLARGVRRDLAEKGWVPLRYWTLWGIGTALALVAFYVVLTPLWLGLRVAAWLSDRRRRLSG